MTTSFDGVGQAVATMRNGRRVYVDPDDPRALDLVRAGGDPEPVALGLWRRLQLAHDWDLVVAAGVGYGEALVGADPPPGAQVVALEPDLARHPYLRRTLAENGLGRVRLRPHALAAAPRSGTEPEDPVPEPGGTGAAQVRVDVPVTNLDEVVGPWQRSFCVRAEVAGSARAVVRGASAVLRYAGPWVLMLAVDGARDDPVGWLADLAASYDVLLLEPATHTLVAATPDLLDSSAVHRDHLVLAAPAIVDALLDGLV